MKLIVGCGYLGARVADLWRAQGAEVGVLTRSVTRATQLEADGFRVWTGDVTCPESLAALPSAETVLFAVGFDRAAGHEIEEVYAGGLRNVLAALPADTGRVVYISTTGVYGATTDGTSDWVDEQTPPAPMRAGGRASLQAEQVLAAHPLGHHAVILRLAGIYGPGRVPFIQQLRDGAPIATEPAGFLNLIHVEDGAATVLAAENYRSTAAGPHLFCVSDGQPVVRGEFYREVARLLDLPAPTFVPPQAGSFRAARAASSKRIANGRLLDELRVHLKYPSCRAGLAEILGSAAPDPPTSSS